MKYQSAILLSGLLSGEVSAQMFKKVKLKDVDVLTLYQGKMTNGRRSSPIPQLQVIRSGLPGRTSDRTRETGEYIDILVPRWKCRLLSIYSGCSPVLQQRIRRFGNPMGMQNRNANGIQVWKDPSLL